MYSTEIIDTLKNVPNFLGVFSRDTLPQPKSLPFSLIANTDKRVESGTHWIAIFVDKSGRGEYFDSYGRKPFNKEFVQFLKKFSSNYTFNRTQLQCITCVTCGEYSCAYIILRTAGYSKEKFIKLFTDDTISNDIIIKEIFKTLL